ncbi:hypothetical protein EMIHUDRAFT_446189 [Emiliania huxleyi CCMP1516]|uniref:Uncharacterized protein n=2 Tax=Emiliania huxleyi TaxID=2903 RepID=A0A0D3IH21_EMIH1|nr:hypothetical protein EMIHUDRAFT_446189 [Emiliania huxleyi CCMP1516]EOD10556.1 hypothetical protein EMIHUDRAFT_446189 [Emiliania huxleyi CCMP1516]|eukprot:XP_005762985.1 hypothetical protein EMIHUDRAFT_446189 [Emiliania huxleyi CCMP1516]
MCTPTQGVWQPAGCVSCELVCVCVSLVRVVVICPASTHTALVSSPSLTVLHLPFSFLWPGGLKGRCTSRSASGRSVEALRPARVREFASAVRQVAILGRRGVLQAAFTIKELRELTKLAGVSTSNEAPPDAFSAVVLSCLGSSQG